MGVHGPYTGLVGTGGESVVRAAEESWVHLAGWCRRQSLVHLQERRRVQRRSGRGKSARAGNTQHLASPPTRHHDACYLWGAADALHARERPDRFRSTDLPARSQRLCDAHLADANHVLFWLKWMATPWAWCASRPWKAPRVPGVPTLTPRRTPWSRNSSSPKLITEAAPLAS